MPAVTSAASCTTFSGSRRPRASFVIVSARGAWPSPCANCPIFDFDRPDASAICCSDAPVASWYRRIRSAIESAAVVSFIGRSFVLVVSIYPPGLESIACDVSGHDRWMSSDRGHAALIGCTTATRVRRVSNERGRPSTSEGGHHLMTTTTDPKARRYVVPRPAGDVGRGRTLLDAAMGAQRVSLRELEDRAQVSRSTISNLANGRGQVALDKAERIATALQHPVGALFGYPDE